MNTQQTTRQKTAMTPKAEHEIEIKIMLREENIPHVATLFTPKADNCWQTEWLENRYYDTPSQFFAHQKMGLRVRSIHGAYEMTLKTQGQIIGGLHSRPEYSLKLANPQPDFIGLVRHFNLPFEQPEKIQAALMPLFSTDFTRQSGILTFRESQIEIALDRGQISTQQGHEPICELELELKSGNVADLLAFLDTLPTRDGFWFSALSKAERGYLLADPTRLAKKQQDLTACTLQKATVAEKYHHRQKLEDVIRCMPDYTPLHHAYFELRGPAFTTDNLETYLTSAACFREHINWLKSTILPLSNTH